MNECQGTHESPVAMAVVCPAGEVVAALRMDGVASRIMAIALAKAYSAAWRESSTLALKNFLETEGLPLADFGNPRLTSMPGGVPVRVDGRTLGAVGGSGSPPAEDNRLAELLAAWLTAAVFL